MIMYVIVHATNKNISNEAVIATSLRHMYMEKKRKGKPFLQNYTLYKATPIF